MTPEPAKIIIGTSLALPFNCAARGLPRPGAGQLTGDTLDATAARAVGVRIALPE
jgi:hypothetical protein